MGSMLGRARHAGARGLRRCAPTCARSARFAQAALDNVRGLSQTLHPSILEELGLESTIDWYLSTVEKQLGITVAYERSRPGGRGGRHDRRSTSTACCRRR